ncbi:hypothetical protein [Geothrix sp. PMB-07]|uniref:hypothetical protein n=1 Tax=Geothrix sp. PMB-07 TaxID=3068640 RepID=UPI002741AA89|nr:hypothetical protein [Geothrix sp. PMB-07]WLT30104.1 hypothetical protein Q9293_10285 [Geothrix sp. PMB-07]
MVKARPEFFRAYVGTGQVADSTQSDAAAYQGLLKKAIASGNLRALAALKSMGQPPYASGQGYRLQRTWANHFEGADQFLFGTIGLTLVAPGNSVQDIHDSVAGQMLSGERLVPQTTSLTPNELGLEFAVPILFFQGREDFTTPTSLSEHYLNAIKAPRKAFVPLAGGHFTVFMNSHQFLAELIARVLPLCAEK